MFVSVSMDAVDAIGHWVGNTRREVYSAKIPKTVSYLLGSNFNPLSGS